MTVATYPGGGSAATKSWKYQGRLDVAASGPSLYDFQAREMSPGLGSFTSNDTVLGSATNPRQLNRYVYAAANPTSMVDPDGHRMMVDGGAEAAANTRTEEQVLDDAANGVTVKSEGWSTPVGVAPKAMFVPTYAGPCAFDKSCQDTRQEQSDNAIAHLGLGACGMVPVVGIGCNLADAGLSASEGDWLGAGLSLLSIIPVAGMLTNGLKLLRAGTKVARAASEAVKVAKEADTALNLVAHGGSEALDLVGAAERAASKIEMVAEDGARACGLSSTGDAPVATPTGSQRMDSLEVGDTVIAWDEATQRVVQRAITAVLPHPDDEIATLILSTGRVTTTPDHPFYTLEAGWVEAGLLRPGMHVKTPTGSAEFQFVKAHPYSGTLWDLTIEGAHTFFVGSGAWLVHNSCNPAANREAGKTAEAWLADTFGGGPQSHKTTSG